VTITAAEKRSVKRRRRRAERRERRGEHERSASRARFRGWWYA
jgi:hypothetical protein